MYTVFFLFFRIHVFKNTFAFITNGLISFHFDILEIWILEETKSLRNYVKIWVLIETLQSKIFSHGWLFCLWISSRNWFDNLRRIVIAVLVCFSKWSFSNFLSLYSNWIKTHFWNIIRTDCFNLSIIDTLRVIIIRVIISIPCFIVEIN